MMQTPADPDPAGRPAAPDFVPADLTVAVLAGGRGSRMGATKDRLTIAGRPVLAHLLDRLAHAGPTLLVTAADRRTPVGHERFGRVASDLVAGAGPLAGIAAALAAATTPLVAVLSVDMPNVAADLIRWLTDALTARPSAAGLLCARLDEVGRDTSAPTGGKRGGVEPFPSIYRAASGPLIAAELSGGRRAVHTLLELPSFTTVTVPDRWPKSVWLNLNRPQDLQEIDAEIA